MAKAGLYALGFVLLCGVLLIGAGFVSWDLVHDQPKPLRPQYRERSRHRRRDGAVPARL
jgi:hypothetical protein